MSPEAAGDLKSVLPLLSMIGMPLFGLLVDKIGKRALLMAAGSALLVPPFLFMIWTALPLKLSMAMLGLAFALGPAVLWPAVTYLVPDARLGSAYALMTFCQQVGWAGMSWGLGLLKDGAKASAQNPAGWTPGSSSRSSSGRASGARARTGWRRRKPDDLARPPRGRQFVSRGRGHPKVKRTVVPFPASPSAQTVPPCLWTIFATIARPMPSPGNSASVWAR